MERPDCRACGFFSGHDMSDEAARKIASFSGQMPRGQCFRYPTMVNKQPRGEGCGEHTALAGRNAAVIVRGAEVHGANAVRVAEPELPAHAVLRVPPEPAPAPQRDAEPAPRPIIEDDDAPPSGSDEALAHFRANKPNARRRG